MNSKFNMYAYISYIQAKMNINDYKEKDPCSLHI